MNSDEGKIYVGGISWNTNENHLREYFSNFGEVLDVTVMRYKATGLSRGYGFVLFSDPAVIDRVLQDKHQIHNREVVVKRKTPREEHNLAKRIFVGHMPPSLTLEKFRAYFEAYGPVSDAVIMIDQGTQCPRGFGFVSFDSEDSVDHVLRKNFHCLNGNLLEVQRALPKDANPGVASGGGAAGAASSGSGAGAASSGGRVGAFPVYDGSGGSGYEGHKDSNRYMQPQNTGSGYPPYGVPGYGYGSYGVGYEGFGGYGYPPYGASGYGYGSYGVGYYGYPAGMPYGNPGVPEASGRSSSRGAQEPSGYANVEYGNASPEGGSDPGSAVMEQVGGSAVNDSSNGAPSAYGAVDGSGGDGSNGSGGYENHQANNGEDAMVEVVEKMGKLKQ